MNQSQWRESSKRTKSKPRSSARKPTTGWTCYSWIPSTLVVLLSLSITLLSVQNQLKRRTTSSVITWTLSFESGIKKIFVHQMLQVGFKTTSCKILAPLATIRYSPRASPVPWDMSSHISASSTTLLRSNASGQDLHWKSLWRLSRRLRMTRPQMTSWRRKEILLNCRPKLCRHICWSYFISSFKIINDTKSKRTLRYYKSSNYLKVIPVRYLSC